MMRDVRGAIRPRLHDPQPVGGTLERASQRLSMGDADELRPAEPGGAFQIEPVRGGEQLLEPLRVLRDGKEVEDAATILVHAASRERKTQAGGGDQAAQI